MSQLKHFTASAGPSGIADALREDGACIIDNAMSPDQLGRLKHEIMPYVEATSMGKDDFTGRSTSRTGALGEQPLHRDRLAWGGFLPSELEPQLNTIWAVTDFTQENGATRVVPGSNTWDPERQAQEDEIAYAEMKAGSVLVYSGSVVHSGGKNQSDTDRMGLNITYCLGWLRQEENQYLSCPPDIAKDFSPELQALLGYAMGSYALGYFTPPLPPGEGPEITPPDWLFGAEVKGWGDNLYDKVSERAAGGAM
eukprot:g14533.t1